jgi:hypothetical protein
MPCAITLARSPVSDIVVLWRLYPRSTNAGSHFFGEIHESVFLFVVAIGSAFIFQSSVLGGVLGVLFWLWCLSTESRHAQKASTGAPTGFKPRRAKRFRNQRTGIRVEQVEHEQVDYWEDSLISLGKRMESRRANEEMERLIAQQTYGSGEFIYYGTALDPTRDPFKHH